MQVVSQYVSSGAIGVRHAVSHRDGDSALRRDEAGFHHLVLEFKGRPLSRLQSRKVTLSQPGQLTSDSLPRPAEGMAVPHA